jgi:enamine deaminase RidA (YjgF/YER057c/UK114 family)
VLKIAALSIAIAVFGSAAQAQTSAREQATVLMSENQDMREIQEQLGFNDAIVTDDGHIYLSGVVVSLAAGDADIEAAFATAYEQIGHTLERAGADWGDVVDILSFHTDIEAQLAPMTAIQRRHISEPFPAWTAVQVERLVPENGITEIKFVARLSATD